MFVYILTNYRRTLYIGVTSDLPHRLEKRRNSSFKAYATRYNCDQLVYMEHFDNKIDAITREKQLKGWMRYRKIALIESVNPKWEPLAID